MIKSAGSWLSALAVFTMMVPGPVVLAAEFGSSEASVIDVALTSESNLVGTLVTSEGVAAGQRIVQICHRGNVVAEVRTDANGRYAVQNLRPGVHVVRTSSSENVCRFWSADTAPPSAIRGLLMADDGRIVRGQCGCDTCGESCGEGCDDCGCGHRGHRGLLGGLAGGAAGVPLVGIAAFGAVAVAVGTSAANGNDAAVQPASP